MIVSLIELNEVSSTNDHIKKLAVESDLHEGSIVTAKFQNNGRGLGKNYWESEKGKNLTFSLLLRPTFLAAHNMFLVSKVISLGIHEYFKQFDDNFSIKWPNDIYYKNKKLGGILIENQLLGSKINYSIIGIGINVNQSTFCSNAPNPISLAAILGKEAGLEVTFKGITDQIAQWYKILMKGDVNKINETYFSHLLRNTGFHLYSSENEQFLAKIIAVENDGQLILETIQNEIRPFYFKEVEFIF